MTVSQQMVRTLARDTLGSKVQDFAGPCIKGVGDAPLTCGVDHAVGDEGRRFKASGGAELSAPEEAELADVLFGDLAQGAEALLVGGSSVDGPIGAVSNGWWSWLSQPPMEMSSEPTTVA